MAIISFAQTTPALLAGKKTVTRRLWKRSHFKNWQSWHDGGRLIHQAYDNLPIQGGVQVGWIRLTKRPYREPLQEMPQSHLEKEGGYWDSLSEFWEMWDVPLDTEVAVVHFRFSKNKETLTDVDQ